jgi:hypothetical protein
VAEKKLPTGDPCKEKFIKELARTDRYTLQASEKGGLIHQMHKSQSNVTIAMTEFDNLRELNPYAIDIARDYFAMAANDPRREETAREKTETEPAAVLTLMERAVSALPPPQHRILLPKKRGSKTESL